MWTDLLLAILLGAAVGALIAVRGWKDAQPDQLIEREIEDLCAANWHIIAENEKESRERLAKETPRKVIGG